jgi:hypothetical protein
MVENARAAGDLDFTFRAQLRVTAAKILRLLGIDSMLGNLDIRTTDQERDNLLRIIYKSNWPDDRPELVSQLMGYIGQQGTWKERLAHQLRFASQESKAFIAGLETGETPAITRYTEPVVDIPET